MPEYHNGFHAHRQAGISGHSPPSAGNGMNGGPPPPDAAQIAPGAEPSGDLIYGARAIAIFLFADGSDTARRRVFSLWSHYHARKENAGFLKLKGALCLSKKAWRAFHGLL